MNSKIKSIASQNGQQSKPETLEQLQAAAYRAIQQVEAWVKIRNELNAKIESFGSDATNNR